MEAVRKPTMYRLAVPMNKLNWFFHFKEKLVSYVNKDGTVTVHGYPFQFLEESPLKAGDEVLVWASNNLYCCSNEQHVRYTSYLERLQEEKHKADVLRSVNLRKSAELFYSRLSGVPFKFHTAIKERLAALSENSMGTGAYRNTVFHAVIDEDFTRGRYSRKKGQFLCTQEKGRWGANWTGSKDDQYYLSDLNRVKYVPKITCKKCLERLEKYNQTNE